MSTRYRVALDARRLAGNRRGIGLYVHNLVRRLHDSAPDIDFLLFIDRPLPSDSVPLGCRLVVFGAYARGESQSVSKLASQLHSVYWMNVLVPMILEREGVDLFHGANVAIPLAGGCRSIATIHDMVSVRVPDTFSAFYRFYRSHAVPAAARRAAHIISVSDSTKNDVVELIGIAPEKITTIHHGVDPNFVPVTDTAQLARTRVLLGLPQRYIVHVGAVERQKRLEPLLQASAMVIAQGLLDAVVLAGEEGFGADKVRQTARELGIAERVRFLGYVDQEHIPSLYSMARCAVYPSWYEGFGMPLLEAMACGTPVISSNTSSFPEVGGDAAILLPPGDVSALSRSLIDMLTDERARADRVHRGLEWVRHFTWERCAARHVEVYRRELEAVRLLK